MGLGAGVGAWGLHPWTSYRFALLEALAHLSVSSSPLQLPNPAPLKVVCVFFLPPFISVPPILRDVGPDISRAMMCFFHQCKTVVRADSLPWQRAKSDGEHLYRIQILLSQIKVLF